MAKGKKTGGRDWAPGVCVNPKGRPKLPDDIKKIRVLTNEHLKSVGDLIREGLFDELTIAALRKLIGMVKKHHKKNSDKGAMDDNHG